MKVYDAEDNAAEQYPRVLPAGLTTQQWVDGITRSPWWRARVDERPRTASGARARWARTDRVRVVEREVGLHSYASNGATDWWAGRLRYRVTLAPGAHRDPWVILHELAHVWTDAELRVTGHGREFRWSMLQLVDRWIGPDAARILRAEYAAAGLRYRRTWKLAA